MADVFVFNTTLPGVSWQSLVACSYSDTVAVFRFQFVNDPVDLQQTELQAHEISQALRYHREEDRNRFVYARRMLRILVGRYVKKKPNELIFKPGINKKPEIENTPEWHMNVSHSGGWITVAIGKSSVGVDIERINPDFPFQDVLAQSFSQEEQAYVAASADSRFAFYDVWTRKEALVKATAKGLDDDFQQVPSLDGIHQISSDLIGAVGDWTVLSFPVSDAYPAAVAYRPMADMPKFYTLDKRIFYTTNL